MRLVVLILSALLVAAPAAARDPAIKDGRFTICVFQNFEKCELLTKRTMRLHGVTEHDTQVLKQLKRHAEARHTSVAALEQSFGKASKVFPHSRPRDSTIAWFQDSVGMNDLKAKCPECGIYVSLFRDSVTGINYIVEGKFTVAWNRATARKRPRMIFK